MTGGQSFEAHDSSGTATKAIPASGNNIRRRKDATTDFRRRITDPSSRAAELNKAVKMAAEIAGEQRCGILITLHDFTKFTVALSPDVPFGLIQEHDLAKRE
ncbi:hypothetical protein FBY31_0329 [Arthrobacter sp. SLBN-100]|nr:hypothetical protein FBY31_0329 [Arthrobacter sp. SLBN-100]